jgi:geranylgeranyl pyrophosphate synthase
MKKIFMEYGEVALAEARQQILISNKATDIISQSLRHFSKVTLKKTLPVFPALIAISCKAAGGEVERAVPFGKAMVLITGAADLHDDAIDKSTMKGPKPTVLGKFGEAAAVLAGDMLLVEGITLLNSECERLPEYQGQQIKRLMLQAIKDISTAETLETNLRKHLDLPPTEFYKIICLKAVVPELTMKIGGILANADPDTIETLGQFGKAYGIISIISDECADIFDSLELTNRLKNECAPLPLVYALQNPQSRDLLIPLLDKDLTDAEVMDRISDIVFGAPEVNAFLKVQVEASKKYLNELKYINKETWEELKTILSAPLLFFSD